MKKLLVLFFEFIIFLFLLSVFGWMVSHIVKGDKKFGWIEGAIKFMYTFPDMFTKSVKEVKKLPETFIATPEDFNTINNLEKDVMVMSAFSDTGNTRSMVLMNLKDNSIHHKWTVDNPHKKHTRVYSPVLLEDKSVIFSFDCISGLRRIDSNSTLIWKQDSIFHHHSMNFDKSGDLWVCSFEPVWHATGMYKLNGRKVYFKDNYLTKVDTETGYLLYHKSMTEILKDHNLVQYIIKSANAKDPLHINDIQPALKTTKYYKEDDIFVSFRNLSIIMQYRPATDEVIRIIEGPFTSQHDVDFYNDTSLVFFNNNFYNKWTTASMRKPKNSAKVQYLGDIYSNIVRYDFWNDSFEIIGEDVFKENKIFTPTEGLQEYFDSSKVFVEEQNSGVLWVIENDKVLYKNVLKSQHEGYHHLPNWIRIIK